MREVFGVNISESDCICIAEITNNAHKLFVINAENVRGVAAGKVEGAFVG